MAARGRRTDFLGGLHKGPQDSPRRVSTTSPYSLEKTESYRDLQERLQVATAFSHGKEMQMKDDVSVLQARLDLMKREMRFLINPNSKKMQYWDIVTIAALFFTLTITPYEVALLPTKKDALLLINQVINAIFIVDIIVNCMLPYRESINRGAGLVRSHTRILKRYATGWMFLDIVSVLPFDILDAFGVFGDQSDAAFDPTLLRMIRLTRLLRLLKLFRILKASRIFQRWENSISIMYSTRSLLLWFGIILIMVHWWCCGWALAAQLHGSQRMGAPSDFSLLVNERVLADPAGCTACISSRDHAHFDTHQHFCLSDCLTDCELDAFADAMMIATEATADQKEMYTATAASMENWVCRAQRSGELRPLAHNFEIYAVPLSQSGFVQLAITAPANTSEYLLTFIFNFLAQIIWAMFTGIVCGIVATGDPQTAAFKNRMDGLNYFFSDVSVPSELRRGCREYMQLTREMVKKSTHQALFSYLSPALRGDINYYLSSQLLASVWFLRETARDVQLELAVRFEHSAAAAKEKVHSNRLYVVTRGVAARAGNILTVSMCWGEDIIISSPLLRDSRNASALTYLEIASLSREDIHEAIANDYESAYIVRQAALKIAMQRAIVLISAAVARTKVINGTEQSLHPIMDAIHGKGPVHDLLGQLNEDGQVRDLDTNDGDVVKNLDGSSPDLGTPRAKGHHQRNELVTDELLTDLAAASKTHGASIAALTKQIGKQQELLNEISAFVRGKQTAD